MASLKHKILALLAEETLPVGVVNASFLPGYHRDSVFKALEGLVEEGKVSRQAGHLSLTPYGSNSLRQLSPFFRSQGVSWDGLWRLVFFDVPESSRSLRDSFRRDLRSRGFGLWQNSTWVSPYNHDFFEHPEVLSPSIRKHVELFKGLRVLPSDERKMADRVWSLGPLNKAYLNVYQTWERCFGDVSTPELLKLKEVSATLQDQYLSLLYDDPGLPAEVLPEDWGRDLVSSCSWQWRRFLKL